ncbi:MAG: hypothetical protein SynsKO_21990 [Synoicihabitans sp.]
MVLPRRLLFLLSLLLGLIGSSGLQAQSAGSPIKWMRGIYVAESPAPQPVPETVAIDLAKARAKALGGVAIRGNGGSMKPLYEDGVIMVIAPADYEELKRGQTVVYQNQAGRTVAHVLIAKCKTGWRVAGLNNRTHDGQGVNAQNLRGVVVDAFAPMKTTTFASR